MNGFRSYLETEVVAGALPAAGAVWTSARSWLGLTPGAIDRDQNAGHDWFLGALAGFVCALEPSADDAGAE